MEVLVRSHLIGQIMVFIFQGATLLTALLQLSLHVNQLVSQVRILLLQEVNEGGLLALGHGHGVLKHLRIVVQLHNRFAAQSF